MREKLYSWDMIEPKKDFCLTVKPLPELEPGEVLVKVAGCGVCHTDLSFKYFGVQTRHELPLTLGHEVSGTIVKGSVNLIDKKVIIPAVLPCGKCELCKKGRSNICRNQKMPGNDFDGGFASHLKVPSKYLCPVPDKLLKKYSLEQLSIIADAISTPYQVIEKSELEVDDFAIIIGVGGVGIYGALIAKIEGAKVLAIDIDDSKLTKAKENNVDAILNIKGMNIKEVKQKVRAIAKGLEVKNYGWKIFEFSGTKPGQETAFSLVTFASTLSVVGFTMDKLELRLSNLMAFDAKVIGTWGCKPELYPEVVELIASEKLKIDPFIEVFPMSKINEVFKNTLEHKYTKRSVLIPDFHKN